MNNILKSLIEFNSYIKELEECSPERKLEIRQEAIACHDLINYSWEIVDTNSTDWINLVSVVDKVLILTNKI